MILSISSSAAYSVFRSKAILVRKKIQYSSKYDDNCLCIIFSNTFEIVGRREIGL